MRFLYLRIYLAFVGILVLFGVLVAASRWLGAQGPHSHQFLEDAAVLVADLLPAADLDDASDLEQALARLGTSLQAYISIYDNKGAHIASHGETVPLLNANRSRGRVRHFGGPGPVISMKLPDGRWVVARKAHYRENWHWLSTIALLSAAIAVGAYPVVRRITLRLENLRRSVDALGHGNLSARIETEGTDEVSALASSFNQAASRIERLVKAHETTLASASHELRSPLARIRVAIEMMSQEQRLDLKESVVRDIDELDDLIEDLLITSRLRYLEKPERKEEIDLLALLAEEGARCGAEIAGEPIMIRGELRTLRPLLRNLLENGFRHGGDKVKAVVKRTGANEALLSVEDNGPGIAEDEAERVFEPFYRSQCADTSRNDTGVGLGLALVRQIARHYGGDARVCAPKGRGARIEVTLPLDGASPSAQ